LEQRPTGAFILSLIGSLFVVMGTILGYLLVSMGSVPPVVASLVPALVGVTLVFGGLMLVASFLLYLRPELHVVWGVLVLVLAVGSSTGIFVGGAGVGLGVVGIAFGIIGGMFAIMWRPGAGMPGFTSAAAPYRVCPGCGRSVSINFAHCPFCGAPAAMATPPARGEPSPSAPR
jgi:hypothetical protein